MSSPQNKLTATTEIEVINGYDRLSNLPDSIIHHIFSFLVDNNMASLSILSRRFKDLCRSSPYLCFHNFESRSNQCKQQQFVRFIDEILSSRNGLAIHKFRLRISRYLKAEVPFHKWIQKALMCNVQELDLNLSPFMEYQALLPPLKYASVKVLKLENCSLGELFEKGISTCCTSLKRLQLTDVLGVPNYDIIVNSSSLESLELSGCTLSNRQRSNFTITSPSLRQLEIYGCIFFRFDISVSAERLETLSVCQSKGVDLHSSFGIFAPNLKSVEWIGVSLGYIYSNSFMSLQEASIGGLRSRIPSLYKERLNFLRSVNYATSLRLDICIIEEMFMEQESAPSFNEVQHLHVRVNRHLRAYQVAALISFLSHTTNLRSLTVKYAYDSWEHETISVIKLLEMRKEDFYARRNQSKKEILSRHLEEVKLELWEKGMDKELKSFLFKHAKGLKKMTINYIC